MSMSPRACPVCACLLILLAALSGCADERTATPRVATNNWPGYWPLYLAVRNAPEPIAHLTELRSATAVMRAFRNGAVDIAALTLDEALVLAAEGLEVCVFLVVDVSHGGDALVAQPSIESVAALAGRRIGVEASAVGAYLLSRIYDETALAAGAATIVEIPVSDHARAFANGEVDAVITFDPTRAELVAGGARELFSSRDIPGEILDVLVARPAYLADRRDAVVRLVRAWRHAARDILEQRAVAFDALSGFVQGEPARLDAALEGIVFPSTEAQRDLLNGELDAVAARLGEVMRRHQLLAGAGSGRFDVEAGVFEAASR